MNKHIAIALIVTLIFLAGIFGYLYFAGDAKQAEETSPTPTVVQETPSPSPITESGDQAPIDETGTLTDIVGPVGYKNSLLIQVDNTNVYVTEDTQIKNQQGQMLTRAALREGATLVVLGVPAEGGIEATEITFLSPVTSPANQSSPAAQ